MATREHRQALEAAQVEHRTLNDQLSGSPELTKAIADTEEIAKRRREVVELERELERLRSDCELAERDARHLDTSFLAPHLKEQLIDARGKATEGGVAGALTIAALLGGAWSALVMQFGVSAPTVFLALLPCLWAAWLMRRRQQS